MIREYFFSPKKPIQQKKQQTSGSFGFKSSEFSQKNNNSIDHEVKNIDPSFFNQSSIKKLNGNESGQFIYFESDSVLSQLELELKGFRKSSQKQSIQQKKKIAKVLQNQKQISFEDSLAKSNQFLQNQQSHLKQYGTKDTNLPITLKKPKFGFKISETAQSSEIIEQQLVENEYQIKLVDKKNAKKSKLSPKKHSIQEVSPHSNIRSQDAFHLKKYKSKRQENSQVFTSIKNPIQQPSLASKSMSQSNSLKGSMNFKSAFKNKVQKASSINSSLTKKYNHLSKHKSQHSLNYLNQNQNQSKSKNSFLQAYQTPQIKIPQLKDLRLLQNQLGQLKHQNKKIIQYMIEKDEEIQKIKRKKKELQQDDPYAVMKQNELMRAFLNKKEKCKNSKNALQTPKGYEKYLHSARSLKQISLKKSSQISSLHDYDVTEHKFKVQPKPLRKSQKQFILANRGMVFSDKYLDVGYSLKDNLLTVYMTLKRNYDQVRIKLEPNSLILSQGIERVFKNSSFEKQIKFKTQIHSTKINNVLEQFTSCCLKISLSTEQKFQNKVNQFKVQFPITVYSIAKQLQVNSHAFSSQRTSKITAKQTYKTQMFVACKQMIHNPEQYLLKLFPCGIYYQNDSVFQVGFNWKQKIQVMKIKIKQRSFFIQGDGNPNKGTFEILRSIVSLMIEEKGQAN